MIAVTSPGFVLFAALLAGLWYVCPPPRRFMSAPSAWQRAVILMRWMTR